MNNKNLKVIQEKSSGKKTQEKWWNEDMRIKTDTGVPDLPIFLLNANLKENRDWIRFVILNLSQDKEEKKIKLLRLFFLMRSLPPGILKKQFFKEFEIWENLKKKLDEDWERFSEREGFYQNYQLEKRKVSFRLLFSKYMFNKKNQKTWQEWETLSKASFAYNFHLLGEIICNIISYFGERGKIEKLPTSKESQFKIEFDIDPKNIPDILITSEKGKEEKLGIEVVEVSSDLIKRERKKKEESLGDHIPNRVEKQYLKSINRKDGKIKINPIKDIKGVEVLKNREKDGVFTFSLNVSRTINNFDYLMEKLKERINIKNRSRKKKKIDNLALWTILSASFSMYLFRTDKGYQIETDNEIQKGFLSWFLLKKISENLSNVEIDFDYLIVTFLNSYYCNENSILIDHDPFKKKEWEMIKEKSKFLRYVSSSDDIRVVIPSFYISVKDGKIESLEEDIKKVEKIFKERWKFDINSLVYQEFGPSSYSFYAQDLENKNNA